MQLTKSLKLKPNNMISHHIPTSISLITLSIPRSFPLYFFLSCLSLSLSFSSLSQFLSPLPSLLIFISPLSLSLSLIFSFTLSVSTHFHFPSLSFTLYSSLSHISLPPSLPPPSLSTSLSFFPLFHSLFISLPPSPSLSLSTYIYVPTLFI